VRINEIERFLMGKGSFSESEKSGINCLLEVVRGVFPNFDIYTGVLRGGVRVVIFGACYEGSVNKPAFGIYHDKDGCYFGFRFDDKKLRKYFESNSEAKHGERFRIDEIDVRKNEVKEFLEFSSESDEVDRRMQGAGILYMETADGNSVTELHSNPNDIYVQIKLRRGQSKFRERLLKAYDNKCAISGCQIVEVLEAAHIVPHKHKVDYSVANGILLRADLHTLFDLNLIKIDESGRVSFHESLVRDETYGKARRGCVVRLPNIQDSELIQMRRNIKIRYS